MSGSVRFRAGVVALLLGATAGATVAAEVVRVETSPAASAMGKAAAAEFAKQKGTAAVAVGTGSAASSIAKLCRGDLAAVIVSRPVLNEEIDACSKAKVDFIELPVAFDAVTLIVKWQQVNDRWPDVPLKLVAPDRLSDEARYFNAAVVGGQVTRQDYMSSGEDTVLLQGVARDAHALAYVSLSVYEADRRYVKAVPVAIKAGAPAVAPSAATVANGAYQPLSRPLFLYVSNAAMDQPETRAFVEFLMGDAARLAKSSGLVPLSPAAYQAATTRLRSRTPGTVWAGATPVGLTVDGLQKHY